MVYTFDHYRVSGSGIILSPYTNVKLGKMDEMTIWDTKQKAAQVYKPSGKTGENSHDFRWEALLLEGSLLRKQKETTNVTKILLR